MERFCVGYIVGSLSSTSINRRLALALAKIAPVSYTKLLDHDKRSNLVFRLRL